MTRSSYPSYFFASLAAGTGIGFAASRAAAEAFSELPADSARTESDICAAYLAVIFLCTLGTVLLTGPVCDLLKLKCRLPASAGCLMLAASLLSQHNGHTVLFVILCSAGAGLVFTGGAVDSVTGAPGSSRTGIFMSAAFPGIAAGLKLAPTELPLQYPAFLLIFAACCVTVLSPASRSYSVDFSAVREPIVRGRTARILILTLAAFLFSWGVTGAVHAAPESDGKFAWLIPAAAVFAASLAGGLLSDVSGRRICATVSMLLCIPLFALSGGRFLLYAAALFFAGASVPPAVSAMALLWHKREGHALAVLSLASAAGTSLSVFLPLSAGAAGPAAAVCCAAVSVCLCLSLGGRITAQDESDGKKEPAEPERTSAENT